jgi:hypothetical protein
MTQNKISEWFTKIFIIAIVIFFVWSLLFPGKIGASIGSHTGVVTAVEYNSNIIWGSNIVYFKTVRESSQEDRYCVNDENVKNMLIEAQKAKKEVTVHFKNDYIMWKWQCNGGETIIYKVD